MRRPRPATRERSTRSPPACCRSRSAKRPRPCPSWWRAPRSTASPCASAPRPTPTTRKERSSAESDRRATRAEIEAALPGFVGEISQVPPRFSALRVAGARAYDLARDTEEFELAPRKRSVAQPQLVDMPDADRCVIEAECGKGTYVRALARDLGRVLGSAAHIEALRRTRVGAFGEDRGRFRSPSSRRWRRAPRPRGQLLGVLEAVETALHDIPALALSAVRRG